ncbi:MAG: histidine phosphatase family protein [Paracoccaceae bacterium]
MTKVALMRHYPTAWNGEQRLQGQTDIPLTEEAQATLATLRLPAPWDSARIVSSPLSRAYLTATLLAEGRSVTTDARLVELSWGVWEGRTAKDLLADPLADFQPTHEWGPDTKAPGGESANEAWERLRPALADIAASLEPVLIVAHKALMRLILGHACNWQGLPEIKRGRLYPLTLRKSGLPRDTEVPLRLEPRT